MIAAIAAKRVRRCIMVPQTSQMALMLPVAAFWRVASTIPMAGARGWRHLKQYRVPGGHGRLRLALRLARKAQTVAPSNRVGRPLLTGSSPLVCQCRMVFLWTPQQAANSAAL
jgi:hypothetical protein